jgi:hypothetical protein
MRARANAADYQQHEPAGELLDDGHRAGVPNNVVSLEEQSERDRSRLARYSRSMAARGRGLGLRQKSVKVLIDPRKKLVGKCISEIAPHIWKICD